MSETKRFKFRCWNSTCKKEYTLALKINDEPQLLVTCPDCHTEGVVDLAPYRSTVVEILQGSHMTLTIPVLQLPEIIPTFPSNQV